MNYLFKKPENSKYLYIDPITKDLHLFVAVFKGDTVALDDTIDFLDTLRTYFGCNFDSSLRQDSALHELELYIESLQYDLSIVSLHDNVALEKKKRLIQAQNYYNALEFIFKHESIDCLYQCKKSLPNWLESILMLRTNFYALSFDLQLPIDSVWLSDKNAIFELDTNNHTETFGFKLRNDIKKIPDSFFSNTKNSTSPFYRCQDKEHLIYVSQIFLALVNKYCLVKNISHINFGHILDIDKEIRNAFVKNISECLNNQICVENNLISLINGSYKRFNNTRILNDEDINCIIKEFYCVYDQIKDLEIRDELGIFEPGQQGWFYSLNNNICINFSRLIGKFFKEIDTDYFKEMRKAAKQFPAKIIQFPIQSHMNLISLNSVEFEDNLIKLIDRPESCGAIAHALTIKYQNNNILLQNISENIKQRLLQSKNWDLIFQQLLLHIKNNSLLKIISEFIEAQLYFLDCAAIDALNALMRIKIGHVNADKYDEKPINEILEILKIKFISIYSISSSGFNNYVLKLEPIYFQKIDNFFKNNEYYMYVNNFDACKIYKKFELLYKNDNFIMFNYCDIENTIKEPIKFKFVLNHLGVNPIEIYYSKFKKDEIESYIIKLSIKEYRRLKQVLYERSTACISSNLVAPLLLSFNNLKINDSKNEIEPKLETRVTLS